MRQLNKNPCISGKAFLFILLCSAGSSAQILTIAGKVRDANSLIGIPSVNIFIRDTETGTVTDAGGECRLSLYRILYPAVLVFRHVGYDILEFPLDTVDAYYFIELQPRVIPLPELSVEAAGERMHIEQDLPQAVT